MDLLFSFIVKFPSKCFSDYIKTLGLLSLRKERLVNTMWAKVHFKMLDAGWCDWQETPAVEVQTREDWTEEIFQWTLPFKNTNAV